MDEASRADDGDVFRALADPTRRGLLDALFAADGQTATALGARYPEMTRFGVSKHLRVLEQAGLVTSTRVGRARLHFLNPVPIAQIAHRWIDKYAAPYASALVELEQQATGAAAPHPASRTTDLPES